MIRILCLFLAACSLQAAPRLDFATFFGGDFGEQGNGVALDSEGNVYIVGQTRDVVAAPGSFSSVTGSSFDIFVLKVDPTGTQLLYLAVFGGSARELGSGIAVDGRGAAYVTGWTFSEDFPVTAGAAQTEFGGGTRDAFVAKLSPDGSRLEYATYLGGSTFEDGNAVVVDAQGRIWIAGTTASADFPVTPGAFQSELGGVDDAFVLLLAADESPPRIAAATLYGGATCRPPFAASSCDLANAVHFDGANVLLAGNTLSPDLPLAGDPLQPVWGGGVAFGDAFVAVFDPTLSRLRAATFLGGSSEDQANGVVTDRAGSVYLIGTTGSRTFAVTPDAVQPAFGDLDEAFLVQLDPELSGLSYSTLLGGNGGDRGYAIVSDGGRKIVVVGETSSLDFPATPGTIQSELTFVRAEGGDAYIAQFEFDLIPRFSAAGVVNAASFRTGTLAPGEIFSVFGRGLTSEQTASLTLGADGRVTTELLGVRLLLDGVPAPLTFVGLDQVNAITPYSADLLPVARLQIERDGVLSEPVTLRTAATAPALFTLLGSGRGQAAVLNQDLTLNSSGRPAPRGSVISLFGTGEGQTDPPGVDGSVAGAILPRPLLPVTIRIGNVEAEALYAGAAPGLVAGVIQINVRVPATVIGGPGTPVSFTVGAKRSPSGVTIAVE